MLHSHPGSCPICGGEMVIRELECPTCAITIQGRFETCPFCVLSKEQVELIKIFLKAFSIELISGREICSESIRKTILSKNDRIVIFSWMAFLELIESENSKEHNSDLASDLVQLTALCAKMDLGSGL